MKISNTPAVSIRRSAYAMASPDGVSAEITMYGEIREKRPVNYWTGQPVEGNFILLTDFLEDLKSIANCKAITIRMNSYGGDAGVSNTIHNRLRELAHNGAKLTCVVDGVAMSGGSLIMCACDTVRVNASSLIMIHKAWAEIWGAYNADDLRAEAKENDAWDKMQVEIYKRKTGLSDTVLMHMMSDTTTMTGREAKEKGFADEVIEDSEPLQMSASADGSRIFVGGHQMHLLPGMLPEGLIPVATAADLAAANKQPANPGKNIHKEEHKMTLEELRAQHPDLIQQVEAEARANAATESSAAVAAERDRLSQIDEIGSLFDPALVAEAKYGEHPCTASELALRAAQAARKQGVTFLSGMQEDAAAAQVNQVGAAPGTEGAAGDDKKSPAEKQAAANQEIHNLLHPEK